MIKQLNVRLENKPGALMECVVLLSNNGVDMKALEVTERGTGDYGVVHLIASNLAKATEALEHSGFDFEVEDVLVAEMDDRVGGLASILTALGEHEINIRYLYAFVGRVHGKSLAVFNVDNLGEAESVLKRASIPTLSQQKIEDGGEAEEARISHVEDHFGKDFIW
jgi:hypothetical protein